MRISAEQLAESYDLIVIGAGPAGLSVVRKYADLSGGRVLIVESGDDGTLRSTAQELAKVSATGAHSADIYSQHSLRLFGGTSNIWTGMCSPLEERSFLNSEWPIDYHELANHYPEAARILGLPSEIHPPHTNPANRNRQREAAVTYRPLYHSPIRFNRSYPSLRDWLLDAPNVHVLFNHTATAAVIEQARCVGVSINETRKDRHRPIIVGAEKTVIATGGVQNARFLLLSLPSDHGLPIGNYLAMHPHVDGQLDITLDHSYLQQATTSFPASSVSAMALSPQFCAANGLLSAFYALPAAGQTHQQLILGETKRVVVTKCHIRAEMPLLESNRVYLSAAEKDFLGQPAMQVHFQYHRQSIEVIHQAMMEQLMESGLGRIGPLSPDWKANHGGGHLLCTTRMGLSPGTSVVDRNCQVHGIKNLFVAGSSVFAAAESANPTYTIIALSLRLANHLAAV